MSRPLSYVPLRRLLLARRALRRPAFLNRRRRFSFDRRLRARFDSRFGLGLDVGDGLRPGLRFSRETSDRDDLERRQVRPPAVVHADPLLGLLPKTPQASPP